jgi:hypothetical protein
LVEELNESPLLISMERASDQQLFESLPTLRKLLILLLSERTYLISAFIDLLIPNRIGDGTTTQTHTQMKDRNSLPKR